MALPGHAGNGHFMMKLAAAKLVFFAQSSVLSTQHSLLRIDREPGTSEP